MKAMIFAVALFRLPASWRASMSASLFSAEGVRGLFGSEGLLLMTKPSRTGPAWVGRVRNDQVRRRSQLGGLVVMGLTLLLVVGLIERRTQPSHSDKRGQEVPIKGIVLRALYLRLAAGTRAIPANGLQMAGGLTDPQVVQNRDLAVGQLQEVFDAKALPNEERDLEAKLRSDATGTRMTYADIRSPNLSVVVHGDTASVTGTVDSVAELTEHTYDGRSRVHKPSAVTDVKARLVRTPTDIWLIDSLDVQPRV
jgi:hypothetical protein